MVFQLNNMKRLGHGICALIALVILIDFVLPGKVYNQEILSVKAKRQRNYNAAKNSHYSYRVQTPEHSFTIESKDAKSVQQQKSVTYAVSRVFQEVNWYQLPFSKVKTYYSFRKANGLALPFLLLIALLLIYKSKKNLDNIVLILQLLVLADFVFLLN